MASRYCSFCYRPVDRLEGPADRLISGPKGINICSICVQRCAELLESGSDEALTSGDFEVYFNGKAHKPKEIKAYLDQHIISQDQAKKALAVAVYNHYKRIQEETVAETVVPSREERVKALLGRSKSEKGEKNGGEELSLKGDATVHFKEGEKSTEGEESELPADSEEQSLDEVELHKGNILMVGPTGVGKTALAEAIAELLDVPFVVKDATTLTEAGYVGEDVESIVKSLWEAAGKDVGRASRGIVVIDEVDKLARRGSSSSSGRDVGGGGSATGAPQDHGELSGQYSS